MAPLVVKDRVIVGNAGGEMGVRGLGEGPRPPDGRHRLDRVQRRPGRRGAGVARPHSSRSTRRTANSALTSWPTDGWKHGGAPVWGWLSYDAELDLVYYGTGNPAPWNTEQRPGDNRWSTSVLARNPGDGSLRWAYQFTPADNWDYDSTQEMILTELTLERPAAEGAGALRQERIRVRRWTAPPANCSRRSRTCRSTGPGAWTSPPADPRWIRRSSPARRAAP